MVERKSMHMQLGLNSRCFQCDCS